MCSSVYNKPCLVYWSPLNSCNDKIRNGTRLIYSTLSYRQKAIYNNLLWHVLYGFVISSYRDWNHSSSVTWHIINIICLRTPHHHMLTQSSKKLWPSTILHCWTIVLFKRTVLIIYYAYRRRMEALNGSYKEMKLLADTLCMLLT